MKELRRIIMVNWWLFDAPRVVEFAGHTVLTGANGAGKSSLLDAIQTIYQGGDASKIRFNQRADERSKRSLKTYCLGIASVKPEEGARDEDLEPRESSITHLAITFEDENGVCYNAGLTLSASASQPKAEVELRYILVGPALRPEDFVEGEAAFDKVGMRTSLEAIYERARREAPHTHPSLKFAPKNADFQDAFAAMLSGSGSLISPERLQKAFLGALHFKLDSNIDSFIRRQILEELPMKLSDMQQAIRNYKDISQRIKECIDRLDNLREIAKLFADAAEKERQRDQYRWVAAEAQCIALQERLFDAEQVAESAVEARNKADTAHKKAAATLDALRQKLSSLREQAAAHQSDPQNRVLAAELKATEANLKAVASDVQKAVDNWRSLQRLANDEAPQDIRQSVARLLDLNKRFEDGGAPADTEITATVGAVMEQTKGWLTELEVQHQKQLKRQEESASRQAEAAEKLRALQKGGPELPRSVMALMRALATQGIEAQPACTLVEVVDEQWRAAIESLLGGKRHALLVKPADYPKANRISKALRSTEDIYEVRIFLSPKAEEFLKKEPFSDSVIHKLKTNDRIAKAWLTRELGNVRQAASEADQINLGRSLTVDGCYDDGVYSRYLRPVEPAMGKRSAMLRLPQLRAEVEDAMRENTAAITTLGKLRPVIDSLRTLRTKLSETSGTGASMRRCIALRSEALGQKQAYDATASPEARKIQDQIDHVLEDIDKQGATVSKCSTDLERASGLVTATENSRLLVSKDCDTAASARLLAQAVPGLDLAASSALLVKLQEAAASSTIDHASKEFAINDAASKEATRKADGCEASMNTKRGDAGIKIGEHRIRFKVEGLPKGSTPLEQETWAMSEIARVESTELHQYKEQSEAAEKTVAQTIRGDFSGHLINARKRMRAILDERNLLLASQQFSSGDKYSFKAKPTKQYESIVAWLDSIEEQDAQGHYDAAGRMELFSEAKFKDAQTQVMAIVNENGDLSPEKLAITDYRAYYTFDMMVTTQHGGTFSVQERLSTGSGGERFTPLYIAVATAVSGAYRIKPNPDGTFKCGATLTVFDEGFNNLDVDNIDSCMGILHGGGLQTIVACPDEKAPTLRPYADTYIEMIKEGGNVVVKMKRLHRPGKELLRSVFPSELKKPHLVRSNTGTTAP
jgi:energy-coupling factor transporter ATP-binding protein EcfA2